MIRLGFIYLTIAVLLFSACNSPIVLRPRYQSITADVEVDVAGLDWEVDTDFRSTGLEIAVVEQKEFEIFSDLSIVTVENNDTGWDENGGEIGVGIKAQFPSDEGPSIDWLARVNYLYVEDDLGGGVDDEITIFGFEGHVGPRYSFLINEVILSLHGGVKLLIRRGEEEITGFPTMDLELNSAGVYAGVAINQKDLSGVDFRVDVFGGSESMSGLFASLGIRF